MTPLSEQRGFTLVELLVAITLLSLLFVVLFSGMRTSIRSWQAVDRRIAQSESLGRTTAFVQNLVREAVAGRQSRNRRRARDRSNEAERNLLFSGDAGRVSLVAPGVDALPRSGLYRYTIYSDGTVPGSAEGGNLWVTLAPYRPDMTENKVPPRLLLEGVEAFALSYFGSADGEAEPAWSTQWQPEDGGLPQLVALELVLGGDGGEIELVMAPLAARPQAAGGRR
ncbi:MAG: prepilin-type N-terminal cleavage/methylation domain-containing protein [Pseudomonadota bacterium]